MSVSCPRTFARTLVLHVIDYFTDHYELYAKCPPDVRFLSAPDIHRRSFVLLTRPPLPDAAHLIARSLNQSSLYETCAANSRCAQAVRERAANTANNRGFAREKPRVPIIWKTRNFCVSARGARERARPVKPPAADFSCEMPAFQARREACNKPTGRALYRW